MDTPIQPLPKALADKAKELGITAISLEFSGGNDEGHLYVSIAPQWNTEFERQVEDWAWGVYDYNGAGDGTDYGDTVTYDLEKGVVEVQEWYMERTENTLPNEDLVIAEEGK